MKRKLRPRSESVAEEESKKTRKLTKPKRRSSDETIYTAQEHIEGTKPDPREKTPISSRLRSADPGSRTGSEKTASDHACQVQEEQAAKVPVDYIFAGEDDTDYTDGAPRLVVSHDGEKQCAALLLDGGLSKTLQELVITARKLVLELYHVREQEEVLAAYRRYAEPRTNELRNRLSRLRGVDGKRSEAQRVCDEVNAIYEKLDEADALDVKTKNVMKGLRDDAQNAQLEVVKLLDPVFIQSELLPPMVGPGPWNELREQWAVPDSTNEAEGAQSVAGSKTSSVDGGIPVAPPTPSPSTIARVDADRSFGHASFVLRQAHAEFDRVVVRRERAPRSIIPGCPSDPEHWCVDRVEEDDDVKHRSLLGRQRATRRLIDAEKGYADAKARALAAKVNIAWSGQSSGFLDESHDGLCSGERLDVDVELPETKKSAMQAWMANIPNSGAEWHRLPPRRPSEADEWECSSVAISDSPSMVAVEPERRRIDKWKAMCEITRSELAK